MSEVSTITHANGTIIVTTSNPGPKKVVAYHKVPLRQHISEPVVAPDGPQDASGSATMHTQAVVPDLIAALFKANTEVEEPSEGPARTVTRDPHLRLRRTLTPSSPFKGIKGEEAQFMVGGSSGKRVSLAFSWGGDDFQMDAYVWGADEANAEHRFVACHGVTPGISQPHSIPSARRAPRRHGQRRAFLCVGLAFTGSHG